MKSASWLVLAGLIAILGAMPVAQAIGLTSESGKEFTNVDAEMGKTSSGYYIQSDWAKNTKNGISTSGFGTGYNLKLGPLMLNAGAKAVYISPEKGDDGVAFPVGGGFSVNIFDGLQLFGEGYSAPHTMTNSVKNYVEANGGIAWTPMTPLRLNVGYRYSGVDGEDGRPGHRLIEGVYAGAGLTF